ncbi:MAG: histidine--tRNA ligase [Vicinamibacterales bacterium]
MSTTPPGGTRDFLPEEIRRREHVIDVIRTVYERHAFEPLETPSFENIETLLGKYGEEGNKLIFKILRRGEHEASGEADLALRYDLTVPLARVVAQYQHALPKYFRRYQIQPVWRADRPARGRFREFYQCDIDAIGSTSPVVEAELLAAVSEVMATLGFSDFSIRLNHRRLLVSLLRSAGVPDGLHETALVAIDKLDKIGRDGVSAELTGRGVSQEAAAQCAMLFEAKSDLAGLRARVNASQDSEGIEALANIETIMGLASAAGVRSLSLDASLARGLSYYTGAIMELTVPDLAGSLGGGGRYDRLVGMFLNRDVPACGFSLGLERIIVVMTERGMFPPAIARGPIDVMVTFLTDSQRAEALRLARELRGEALRVEVYPESASRLEKPLKYASSRNVPLLAILGEDEQARNEVAVRDLQTRQQTVVPRQTASSAIAKTVRLAESET